MKSELPTTQRDLQADVELAREAAKRRLSAPPVTEHSIMKLRRKELIELYAPECVNKYVRDGKFINVQYAPFHPNWVEKKTYREWLAKGYEPVVNQGAVVEDEGDVLMKCSQELYMSGQKGPVLAAAARMREKNENAGLVPGAMQESTTAVTPDEAKGDEG